MDDIWQQFHRLPKVIRNAVATPAALEVIDRIERANPGLDLAGFIMRVMVKEFPVDQLGAQLASEEKIAPSVAESISQEVRQQIFSSVGEYLGLVTAAPKPVPAQPMSTPAPAGVPRPQPAPVPAPVTTRASAPSVTPPAPAAPLGKNAPAPSLAAEDDAEIAAHAANLRTMSGQSAGPQDFDTIAQNILVQHRLAFSEELLTKRAISLFKARLKDIRSADETRAMFMRPPKVGGLGLDPDVATAVSLTLDQFAQTAKARGMARAPEPLPPPPPPRVPPPDQQKPAAIPPLTRDFSTLKPDPAAGAVTEAPRMSRPIIRPADIPAPPPMRTAPRPVVVQTRKNVPPAATTPTVSSPATQRPRSSDRPAVADITMPSSTLGPAEEMKSYTLMQFRRLGQGAADSAKKILDKFRHLQEESFVLWASALAGWRQSEVYQIYLDMGRESLELSLPIEKVIANRAATGRAYLSEHEFNVLADMNRRLQV